MPDVLEPQQIIDGFDISALGCKVVSVTILSMRMTHLLVNLGLIWRELGQQFCANPSISFGLFFDRPQGGLQMDCHPAGNP